jgi:hypothetical protein
MNLFVADGARTHAGQDLFLRERRGPRPGFSFGINYNSSAEKVHTVYLSRPIPLLVDSLVWLWVYQGNASRKFSLVIYDRSAGQA